MAIEERVLEELRVIRKSRNGMTLATIAASPVICGLLGDGNPAIALNTLKHGLLEAPRELSISAAIASLGLSSTADTHAGRLQEFGYESGYDERQVRRYSDKGLREVAALISRHWGTVSVPRLDALVVQSGPTEHEVRLSLRQQIYVEMREPQIEIRLGEKLSVVPIAFEESLSGIWRTRIGRVPVVIDTSSENASMRITWIGESWPHFSMRLVGGIGNNYILESETLGTKLVVRFGRIAMT